MVITLTAIPVPSTESIRHKQSETAAFIGENEFGVGTLYISESHVAWISNSGRGFTLAYPSISMHAISRDTRTFDRPCIYIILDLPEQKSTRDTSVPEHSFSDKLAACSLKPDSAKATATVNAAAGGESGDHNGSAREGSDEEENDDEPVTVEVRFVPSDVNALEPIYQALSECQALHPDENDSFSEDEEFGGEPQFVGASDEVQFDDHGQLVVSRMRGVRTGDEDHMEDDGEQVHQEDDEMETGQFEDAE